MNYFLICMIIDTYFIYYLLLYYFSHYIIRMIVWKSA